MEQLETVKHRN